VVNEGNTASTPLHVDAFIEEAHALRDENRVVLAEARRRLDEAVRAAAWKAANEVLVGRAAEYADAWLRIGPAHLPERLEDLRGEGDAAEIERWQDVARLARLALDEALVALLTADTIPPPDVRELLHPWKTMQAAAFDAKAGR
jgi:hypothetical protein